MYTHIYVYIHICIYIYLSVCVRRSPRLWGLAAAQRATTAPKTNGYNLAFTRYSFAHSGIVH